MAPDIEISTRVRLVVALQNEQAVTVFAVVCVLSGLGPFPLGAALPCVHNQG